VGIWALKAPKGARVFAHKRRMGGYIFWCLEGYHETEAKKGSISDDE
jgi:hypothetical protein